MSKMLRTQLHERLDVLLDVLESDVERNANVELWLFTDAGEADDREDTAVVRTRGSVEMYRTDTWFVEETRVIGGTYDYVSGRLTNVKERTT